MSWTQTGNLRGPQGPQGEAGPQGERGPAGVEGPQGIPGAEGPVGPEGRQGVRGEDGKSLSVAGTVPTYAALPTDLTEADAGSGYVVNADGRLYIWDGAAFPAEGLGAEVRGPQGPAGEQGPQGRDGVPGTQGPEGPEGPTGPAGQRGEQGVRGSRWFFGAGVPTSVPSAAVGDAYLDTSSGTVYQLN